MRKNRFRDHELPYRCVIWNSSPASSSLPCLPRCPAMKQLCCVSQDCIATSGIQEDSPLALLRGKSCYLVLYWVSAVAMGDSSAREWCPSTSWGRERCANASVYLLPRHRVHDVAGFKVQPTNPVPVESFGPLSDHTACARSAYAYPAAYPNICTHSNPHGARTVETQHPSLLKLLNRGHLPRGSRRIAVTERSESTQRIPLRIERPEQPGSAPLVNKHHLEVSASSKNCKRSKASPFPEKLYAILQDSRFSEILSWTDHGKSWRVLQIRGLQEQVLPRYFRSDRYTSFMRQVRLSLDRKSIV
jgi:hypothetical protein